MTGVFLHLLKSVTVLIVLFVCRVSSGEVFRRTWSTRATERRTASSTKSPATAVNTAGCRSAWKWGCPKNVSDASQMLPPQLKYSCQNTHTHNHNHASLWLYEHTSLLGAVRIEKLIWRGVKIHTLSQVCSKSCECVSVFVQKSSGQIQHTLHHQVDVSLHCRKRHKWCVFMEGEEQSNTMSDLIIGCVCISR